MNSASASIEPIRRLCVIGVGLIGGSLARALRAADHCGEIVGCGRGRKNLQRAVELGVIDRFETDPAAAVKGADMVVLSVPLSAVRNVLSALRDHLAEDAVVTDAGSAKRCVVDDLRSVFGMIPPFFVPGHPIAGTEESGVDASFAELFQGRRVILTPLAETSGHAHGRVQTMWSRAGADVVDMGVGHHDEILAATSHLPHILAYSLVDTLARMDDRAEIFRYAAGGFRDFTRIASSDPVMWRDICLANSEQVLEALDAFSRDLGLLADAIREGDGERVLGVFEHSKQSRDNLYRD